MEAAVELRQLPGLLQALALLPLTHAEVLDSVQAALADNPMLECEPGFTCPNCGRLCRSGRCARCAHTPADPPDSHAPFDGLASLALCEVRADCRPAMVLFLEHLTDRGLLDSDIGEIAELHSVALADISECLRAVRAAGPVGIAERSITDLLAAQARELVAAGVAEPWLVDLVRDHLPLVAGRERLQVASIFATTESAAQRAFELIADRLRPFAGGGGGGGPQVRIAPDILVDRGPEGVFTVEVPGSHWFGLRIGPVAAEVATDQRAVAWLRDHQRHAQELIQQLDRRAAALERIAAAAVTYQAAYLEQGAYAHRPLTRAALAAAVGVHESTVSRAVKGKRVRLPDRSVIDFSDLFGTATAVRAHLSELCRDATMTDRLLCQELRALGFVISRRTVAKYRAQLGIAPGSNRIQLRTR